MIFSHFQQLKPSFSNKSENFSVPDLLTLAESEMTLPYELNDPESHSLGTEQECLSPQAIQSSESNERNDENLYHTSIYGEIFGANGPISPWQTAVSRNSMGNYSPNYIIFALNFER